MSMKPTVRSFVTNLGLADSDLRDIEPQNDFKWVVYYFQNYVGFPHYSGVAPVQ